MVFARRGQRTGCWQCWQPGLESKAFVPYFHGKRHIMSTLTVTAKGQVTLRKDLLEHLGVHPGDKIVVDKLPDGRIEVKAARPTGDISHVFNFLKKKSGASLSLDEINKIAARGWARRR
jgi:AbrB family looped-hinge helix DNA binding protein